MACSCSEVARGRITGRGGETLFYKVTSTCSTKLILFQSGFDVIADDGTPPGDDVFLDAPKAKLFDLAKAHYHEGGEDQGAFMATLKGALLAAPGAVDLCCVRYTITIAGSNFAQGQSVVVKSFSVDGDKFGPFAPVMVDGQGFVPNATFTGEICKEDAECTSDKAGALAIVTKAIADGSESEFRTLGSLKVCKLA